MRRDARDNRERILAAAVVVFGAHGQVGSTEDVARRAGVGSATVFRHFPTKEALVEAALLRHFDELTTQAEALRESADPVEGWRTLVRVMIETGATKLMLASTVIKIDESPDSLTAAANRLKIVADDLLQRAQVSGAVRPSVTIEEVYLLIRGLAQASAMMPTSPHILSGAIDIVLNGLSPRD